MISKKQIISILLISILSEPLHFLFAQNVSGRPNRQSSIEAFAQGNYEKSYMDFRELLKTYSKDPLYKYYCGVSLIKLNRDPDEASELLRGALQNAGALKTLPNDVTFYLGRALQMSGRFQEAITAYTSYSEQYGKKAARDLGVSDFIEQCNAGKGAIQIVQQDKMPPEKKEVSTVVPAPVTKLPENLTSPVVSKTDSVKPEFLPSGYEKILAEAAFYQYKADSVTSILSKQKGDYTTLPVNEKSGARQKITENDTLQASYQRLADVRYREAERFDIKVAADDSLSFKAKLQIPEDSAVGNKQKEIKTLPDTSGFAAKLKVLVNPVQKVNSDSLRSDSLKKTIPVQNVKLDTYSIFEIAQQQSSEKSDNIVIDPVIPAGLIYRIQIAVFRNPVPPGYFLGITPVYGFRQAGTDKTNYYAGLFRRSADAKKALLEVKTKGFKDAFVVSLADGKPVSSDRAAVMEREWGRKPFALTPKPVEEFAIDTVPPTLVFRVEVMRSKTPLKDEIVDSMEKYAGTRGFDIQNTNDGSIAYIIGKFITFESAEEYSNLMRKNGYREAKVVSWLGKKEINIDTARQLFDDMK
jgi:hypothetical protein